MRNIILVAVAISLGSTALPSALLVTTPACELMPLEKISEVLGHEMLSLGGTADIAYTTECFWQPVDGGPSMDFRLIEKEFFPADGPAGQGYLDYNIAALKRAGEPFEVLSGVGDAAIMTEQKDTHFIDMAAGGDYLSIRLTGGTRDAILAVARIAAKAMSAP